MKKHFFSLVVLTFSAFALTSCGPLLLGGAAYLGYRGTTYSGIMAETTFISSASLAGDTQTTTKTTSTLYKITWDGAEQLTMTNKGEQVSQIVQLKDLALITVDSVGKDSIEATVTDKRGTLKKVTIPYQKGKDLVAVIFRGKKIVIPLENVISLKGIEYSPFYNHMFQQ